MFHPQLWLWGSSSLASGLISCVHEGFLHRLDDILTIDCQVTMKLGDEEPGKGLLFVPGSHGMNVPSACTIVIIAGFRLIHTQTRIVKIT